MPAADTIPTILIGPTFNRALASHRKLHRPDRADPRGWALLGPRRASAEIQLSNADTSSEPGCARDQKQTRPDAYCPDGSRDTLTGRYETFDGDDGRHDSHCAKVHDPDDQEDRHQTGTTEAAVQSKAQAVLPGRAAVGRQRAALPGCLQAAGKVTFLHAVNW